MSEQNTTRLLQHIAVISEFCRLLGDIGKTKLQKLTYLLQEAQGASIGYSFRLHHYGPFSDELDDDLSVAEALGIVTIERDEDGYGFHLKPAPNANTKRLPNLGTTSSGISRLVSEFGQFDASSLEVIATVHYVAKQLKKPTANEVVKTVASLKPRYTRVYIQAVYDSLLASKHI